MKKMDLESCEYSPLCKDYQSKFRSIVELLIEMNKATTQELEKAREGQSDLSSRDIERLLAGWIGIQALTTISRGNFKKLYSLHRQRQCQEAEVQTAAPLMTDAEAPYSAVEIQDRFWELIAMP